MTRSPAAFGLSARLARREVCRRPWRTLLIALLVALPVAGMTLAAVLARSERLSPAASWKLINGHADVVGQGQDLPQTGVTIPSGSTTLVAHSAYFQLVRTTAGVRTRAMISDLAVDQPIVAGIVSLDEGTLPSAVGEVLLSASAARDLHVHVGDTLDLERPTTRSVRVVGIGHLDCNPGACQR